MRAPRLLAVAPHVSPIHEAAHRFCAYLRELERRLRRNADPVPSLETKREAAAKFWSMAAAIPRALQTGVDPDYADFEAAKRELRGILGPWLWRSEYFNRAFHKPHGFAGDHVTLELIYALEASACADPTRPAINNCLDYMFATIPAVRMFWERRHRFARLLATEHARMSGGRLSILDAGCGSAPYLRDFLSALPAEAAANVEITLVDGDPSAISFCRTRSLARWDGRLRTYATALRHVPEELAAGSFDVVLATSMFDESDDEAAREVATRLVALARPGGVVAVAGAHPADPSRFVREWILDWPLELRDAASLRALFPAGVEVETEPSADGHATYASAWVR